MTGFRLSLCVLFLGLLFVGARVTDHQLVSKKTGSRPSKGSRDVGIYYGNKTYIEKHPYLVSVKYQDTLFCAGTIVSKDWVLISGNCLNGYDIGSMTVVAGSHDGQTGTQSFSVLQSSRHPNYDYIKHTCNYGLLQINGNFTWGKKVKRAKLPKRSAKAGTWLTMTGYGESEANGLLREGKTQVLTKNECYKLYEGYTLNLTDTVGCVYNKGKTTICEHDSADPVTRAGVIYHLATAIGNSGYCTSDALPVITSDVYGGVSWIREITGMKK